jgi:hypothetical protein
MLALLLGLMPGAADAYALVSREHGFSIELPGAPDYHGPRTVFLGDNEYNGLGWDYDHYSVHLFRLTPKMGGARFLAALIKDPSRCRVVESDKPIRQGGVAGRDVLIRDTPWTHRHGCAFRRFSLRVRGFVVGNRLYWVQYKTYSKDAMQPEVTRVLDSFRIIK